MAEPLTACSLLLAAAIGQSPVTRQDTGEAPLEAVDQAVGDTNVLDTSFRDIEEGLLQPSAFEQVYKVPGRDDLLMRIDGAIHAIFEQSEYGDRNRWAPVPANTRFFIGKPPFGCSWAWYDPIGWPQQPQDRPAVHDDGTRIGCTSAAPLEAATMVHSMVDAEPLDARPPARATSATADDPPPRRTTTHLAPLVGRPLLDPDATTLAVSAASSPSLFTDRDFRARRLRELLLRAAAADEPSTPPAGDRRRRSTPGS